VDQALKRISLEAYDNMFTSQLEDYLLQYANRLALEFLMHLKQTYGFINSTQLADNFNTMTGPINFHDPIETLFKKIEDGVRYAHAGMQPYLEAQYVNIAFLLILNTGAVPDACRDWQRHTPVNQTWVELKGSLQELSVSSASTASSAGYHTLNMAEHYVQSQLPVDGGFGTVMSNLTTVTSTDHENFATLTKAIATLTDQLLAKDM
jgi:hypothetical protein